MIANKEKLKEYLMGYFDSVYCDNCRNVGNDSACDYCHRKSIGWGISEEAVNGVIADLERMEVVE